MSRVVFIKEIADALGCRTDTVRRMFRENRLPGAFKPGGRCSPIRMHERDLKRIIKTGGKSGHGRDPA